MKTILKKATSSNIQQTKTKTIANNTQNNHIYAVVTKPSKISSKTIKDCKIDVSCTVNTNPKNESDLIYACLDLHTPISNRSNLEREKIIYADIRR